MTRRRKKPKKSAAQTPAQAYVEAVALIDKVRRSNGAEINLSELSQLDRIPPLHGLAQVHDINLRNTKVVDLSPLFGLAALVTLDVGHTKVSDFSILPKLTAIETLNLTDTEFSDLNLLSEMAALRTLMLARTKIKDLTPLAHLGALRKLNVDNTNVLDLSPLSGLTSLYHLSLRHCKVTDLKPIGSLVQLSELYLWNCPVTDFSPLENLKSLQRLELWGTQIADLGVLGGLKELRMLDLDGTNVSDLTSVVKLRSLEFLYLSGSKISDLTPLAAMPSLEIIAFEGTRVVDLRPLGNLTELKRIRMSGSKVADLSPLAALKTLSGLELDNTQVHDLSPLADLGGLVAGAMSKNRLDGLSFAHCPLDDRFLRSLAARENPKRTVDAIAHLRQLRGLPPTEGVRLALTPPPPEVPEQGAGPHFAVREDGVLTFAPPEALDRQGNNLQQLHLMHPHLVELARNLANALSGGNVPYAVLNDRIQSYSSLVDQELSKVSFDRLYVEGVRLQNAASATGKKIEEKELPAFDLPVHEKLDSLLQLHGTFMLSTAVGLDLIGAEQRYKRRPDEERSLRNAAREFAEQLQDRPDIATPEAARFVLKAVGEVPADENPERSAIVATSTAKNAAIVVISGATIGALPVVGAAVAGTAGLIGGGLVALVGAEGLKKSKSFLVISGILTSGLDQLKEVDLEKAIELRARILAPYVGFVLNAEPVLRRLGNLSQFQWLQSSLDWLKEHARRSGDDKASKK